VAFTLLCTAHVQRLRKVQHAVWSCKTQRWGVAEVLPAWSSGPLPPGRGSLLTDPDLYR
jgi:hypothetical protein